VIRFVQPKLLPPTTVQPGAYISLWDKTTTSPCTIKDIAAFVLDYVSNWQETICRRIDWVIDRI
jgi:hypothetical protein